MTDLPLIKAAKLWAKVSARTGAAYLTGRWGGCRVLVFENLERASEAEPSHFLFLGEAGEWPVPDQAAAPMVAAEPAQAVPELRAVPAAVVEDGAVEKPARRPYAASVEGRITVPVPTLGGEERPSGRQTKRLKPYISRSSSSPSGAKASATASSITTREPPGASVRRTA